MKWKKIDGWWGEENALVYKKAINNIDDGGVFVEIGCYLGRSSCCAAEIIKKSKKEIKLFCIDHWKGSVDDSPAHKDYMPEKAYEIFLKNTQEHHDILIPIKKSSTQASKDFKDLSIDYVFIDASHDYKNVSKDIKLWFPKTKKIGGHDYHSHFPGVIKAVKEFKKENNLNLKITGNIWELTRKKDIVITKIKNNIKIKLN